MRAGLSADAFVRTLCQGSTATVAVIPMTQAQDPKQYEIGEDVKFNKDMCRFYLLYKLRHGVPSMLKDSLEVRKDWTL